MDFAIATVNPTSNKNIMLILSQNS